MQKMMMWTNRQLLTNESNLTLKNPCHLHDFFHLTQKELPQQIMSYIMAFYSHKAIARSSEHLSQVDFFIP